MINILETQIEELLQASSREDGEVLTSVLLFCNQDGVPSADVVPVDYRLRPRTGVLQVLGIFLLTRTIE